MEAVSQLAVGGACKPEHKLRASWVLDLRLLAAVVAVALAAAARWRRGWLKPSTLEAWPSSLGCTEMYSPPGSMLILLCLSAMHPGLQAHMAVSVSLAAFIWSIVLASRYAGAKGALLYMCAVPSTLILLGERLEGVGALLCSAAVLSCAAGRVLTSAFLLGASGSFSMLPLLAAPPLLVGLGGRRALRASLALACGYLCVSSPVWLAFPSLTAGYYRHVAESAWRLRPTSLALLPLAAAVTAALSWLALRSKRVEGLCAASGLMWVPLASGGGSEVASLLPLVAACQPSYPLLLLFDGANVATQLVEHALCSRILWHVGLVLLAALLYSCAGRGAEVES